MKKVCVSLVLLIALFLTTFHFVVLADMIFEPPDDFYQKHYRDCSNLNRNFYANGESGFISVKTEPGSNKEVTVIENGEVLNISFTYDLRGRQWGVIALYSSSNWVTGWIPMDDLVLAYDYISFEEDHRDEFYHYSGDYELLFETDEIVFWTWPGSGEIVLVSGSGYRDAELERNWLYAAFAYKDGEGREWGLISYFYAMKNTWICLDDPSNQEIPAFNKAPQPELRSPAGTGNSQHEGANDSQGDAAQSSQTGDANVQQGVDTRPVQPADARLFQGGLRTTILIVILVAVVVAATAILIRILMKPRKSRD